MAVFNFIVPRLHHTIYYLGTRLVDAAIRLMKKALTCNDVKRLRQLPNVGKATVADLYLLNITEPQHVKGRNPYRMYDELCALTKVRHDPCVYDVFISIVKFMYGEPPQAWWHYTAERKAHLASPSSL